MIEIAFCNIRGRQFLEKKKNRNRCGEEIDAFIILLRLSNKLIPITITIFIIIITNKFDGPQETKKYQWKTSYKETLKINASL